LLIEQSSACFGSPLVNLTLSEIFFRAYLGLNRIRLFGQKFVECPRHFDSVDILACPLLALYAINNRPSRHCVDVGPFGYLVTYMLCYGFPVGPVILGVILNLTPMKTGVVRFDRTRFSKRLVLKIYSHSPLSTVLFSVH